MGIYSLNSLYNKRVSSIITDGLVLNLDAGNTLSYPGTGTTWFDTSGNGNNMTLYNGTSYNASGYFDFDGSDDYAKTTNNGLGTGSVIPHSIELWVNFDVITGTRWWLGVIGQYSTGAHHLIGTSTTGTQFGAWGANCQRAPVLSGINNWMQILGTFNGTSLSYYVNGLASGGSCTADGFNFTNTDFTLGQAIGGEAYYNGKIAVARLYNKALSAGEVSQNYNALRGRFGL